LSRNRAFGVGLGRGEIVAGSARSPHGVVEGFASCCAVRELAADHDVDMPITEAVYQVCHAGIPVHEVVASLLDRRIGAE
jgi:glycerol-3-phosphate dehydrogenase (NAD(P)+)